MEHDENNAAPVNLAGYELLRELGRGNNGVVYLARQVKLDRIVACKVLLPELAAEPGFIRNFMREARNAAKLDHPNVIQALDVGTADGLYFFAMEYVDGVSLEHIRVHHPEQITLDFVVDTMIQLADALDYAWSTFHMTHGDVKPDNLMIRSSDRRLKLADLGLAHVRGTEQVGDLMATPMYAAPEVILGSPADVGPRSDLYSFGIMFYELVTGTAPFHGDIDQMLRQHVSAAPPPILSMNGDLDVELAHFIERLIAKTPADRPADWHEVREFLSANRLRICQNPARAIPEGNGGASVSRRKMDTKRIVLLAGLALLLALGVLCSAALYFLQQYAMR